jgi:hypothetical protein
MGVGAAIATGSQGEKGKMALFVIKVISRKSNGSDGRREDWKKLEEG